jgi:hypothetical protein
VFQRIGRLLDVRIGLAALGGLAWVIAAMYYSQGLVQGWVAGLMLVTLGLGLASWSSPDRPRFAALAWGLVIVGMGLFLGPGLFQLNNLARVGSHVFSAAVVLLGAATFLPKGGARWLHRIGCGVCSFAAVLWVIADLDGGLAWEPGNVLAFAGLAWSAVRPPYD